MRIDPIQPSPRGAFFVQASLRSLFRFGLLSAFASSVVIANGQVAPSELSSPLPGLTQQSVLPGIAKGARTPDAAEGKDLIDRKTQRSRGFMENKGQWPENVKFMAQSNGLEQWVTSEGLRINAFKTSDGNLTGHVIGVQFVGSKKLKPEGDGVVGVRTDFLNRKKPVHGAMTYESVISENIYPNIALKNYFDGSRPRYDFVVQPNGDPSLIKMKYFAAEGIAVSRDQLAIRTSIGDLVETDLRAYQMVDGKKKPIDIAFNKLGEDTVGFKVGKYDRSKPLIIDPVVYGSYYGGDSGIDEVHAVVSDLLGGVYMTGLTRAPDFPVIFGPYSLTLRAEQDAYVSKLQGDAYRHDYAAFLGGSKDDVGEFLQLDQFGHLWVAGYTSSPDFPGATDLNVQYVTLDLNASQDNRFPGTTASRPNGDAHFRVRLPQHSGAFSQDIAWDADPATMEITLQTYINAFSGGPHTVSVEAVNGAIHIADGNGYRVTFSSGIKGEMEIDSEYLGAVYDIQRTQNGRAQFIRPNPVFGPPNVGAFTISASYNRGAGTFTATTIPIAYNAAGGAVETALNTMPAAPGDPNQAPVNLGARVFSPTQGGGGGTLPGTGLVIVFPAGRPSITVNQGTMNINYQRIICWVDDFFWDQSSSAPTFAVGPNPVDPNPNGNTFNLRINGNFTVPSVRWFTSAQQLHDAMASANVGANDVLVVPENPAFGTMPESDMLAIYIGNLAGTNAGTLQIFMDKVFQGSLLSPPGITMLAIGRTNPQPVYAVHTNQQCFVMRFKQDASQFLNPLPTKTFFFGGEVAPSLTGFRIVPRDNPPAGDPIRLTFGGNCFNADQYLPEVPGLPRGLGTAGFILRVNYTEAGGFVVVDGPTKYIDAFDSTINGGTSLPVHANGIDVDANGNIYVGGTVRGIFGNTTNTAVNTTVFPTTAVDPLGSLRDGRLLRWWDGYVRKYSSSGVLTYSVLIGGDAADDGFGVSVDAGGNAYLLGRSRSFNYPRTRGVFGETFTSNLVSTVAKLNTSASDLIYCTHLRTNSTVTPVGIAVDARGVAFCTFALSRRTVFQPWVPTNDPNLCADIDQIGVIPLQGDPAVMDGAYTMPGAPDIGSTEGGLIALNPSGTGLLYGTYVGGALDDFVFRPFVDKSGDVWICGYTDTYRNYIRWPAWNGAATAFPAVASLPAAMITPLAFRPTGDANTGLGGPGSMLVGFQLYNTSGVNFPFVWPMAKDREGFVTRLRIGLAAVANMSFAPATIAGGLGANSTGTVVLSQAAPAGGAVVTLSMPANHPGSFSAVAKVSTTSITIPAGANARTFTVYSEAVADNSFVDVTASYQGNFKVARLVVLPWLQSFSITPQEVVGGNIAVGRIQLSAVAGAQGVTVQVVSDRPDVVPIQNVTVPNGQNALAFDINTAGVDEDVTVTLNAALLGVGKPFQLIVHPAQLKSLTFSPNPVTSGTSSTGTLVTNGKPGPAGFDVEFSVQGDPAGYTLTPDTLHFDQDETTKTFVIDTPFESATVNRTVNASMVPQEGLTPNTVPGTLTVSAANITSFTVTPNPIDGGQTAQGQVTLSTAALAGGAKVNLSVSPDNGTVNVPTSVTVLQGQTSVTFPIPTTTTIAQTVFNITASRGESTFDRSLTVRALTFTLNIPPLIASGSSVQGSIALSGPAPAGGIAVQLTSSKPSILAVPSPVTIQAGQAGVTFPMVPAAVTTDTDVTISAKIGATTKFANTTVFASKLVGMTLSPSYVLNLQTVRCTLTLDGPAPANGLTVNLTSTNLAIASLPTSVKVPAGKSSYTFSFPTRRVIKTFQATISGTSANGGNASAKLTVHP